MEPNKAKKLRRIVEGFESRVKTGDRVSVASYVRKHPELAADLGPVLEDVLFMRKIFARARKRGCERRNRNR